MTVLRRSLYESAIPLCGHSDSESSSFTSRRGKGVPHAYCLHGLGNIMHPQNGSSLREREETGRKRAGEAARRKLNSGKAADETLSGNPHEQRESEFGQGPQASKQRLILLTGLGKSYAGVETYLLGGGPSKQRRLWSLPAVARSC